MASGQTPTYLLPYPLATDPVDIHGDIFDLADRLEDILVGVASLPSQSGNNGKFLTTNGSAASWATVSSYSPPTIGSTAIGSGATVTTISGLTALGVQSINLGHASDTQLTRNSAGVLAVNGYVIPDVSSSNVLTSKTLGSTKEVINISGTAATGTIQFDTASTAIMYYTFNATGNWTLNIRGNAGVTLNTFVSTGTSLTVVFMATNGATAYYPTSLTIDGTTQTVRWQGGIAPTSGNSNSIDAYTYTIIKTAANTYTVLGSQARFA